MDEILLLLMHTQTGLKLEEQETLAILKGDPGRPADYIGSARARSYLAERPDWRGESLRILEESEKSGVRWSRFGDVNYPELWNELSEKPDVFNFRGEPCWKTHSLLAVVGSRTPMADTRMWMQRELSIFLRRRKVGIVSGGARGVDQWAHRICMDEGQPTVCILPAGVLNPYPFDNEEMWERVIEGGGCLLSTFGLREPMRKHNFIVRNRWITGLSRGLFVAEANRRSGSSLTAKYAKEENRELATLPVFPHADQGMGNLDLLADAHATLIRDHLDLATMWDRLSPTLFQGMNRESEEQSVHEPERDESGK